MMFIRFAALASILAFASSSYALDCGPGVGKCTKTGECCSQYGWCGTSKAYCGAGCQIGYGLCTGSGTTTPSPVATTKPPTRTTTTVKPTTTTVKPTTTTVKPTTTTVKPTTTTVKPTTTTVKPTTTTVKPATTTTTVKPSTTTTSKPSTTSTAPAASGTAVSSDGICKSNGKICPSGLCCSEYGWCGTTNEHCVKNCQVGWGACAGQPGPTISSTTSSGSTPTSVPSGSGFKIVTQCAVPGTVSVSFDDGPYLYTSDIAAKFTAAGGKTTFFVNGLNFGCIYDYGEKLKAAFDMGHQIGSHTWSHADLQTLTADQITSEMNKVSVALKKILGAEPVYMRPPYGNYNTVSTATLTKLGFKIQALWDVDSGDSVGADIPTQQKVYNNLDTSSASSPHMILQHDTHETTATQMVPFIINWAKQRKLKLVTVGECLGDTSASNWYKNIGTPEVRNSGWVC